MSLILIGRYKVANKKVSLTPLIEELETLWNVIEVLDISRPSGQRGTLVKSILMWAMHD